MQLPVSNAANASTPATSAAAGMAHAGRSTGLAAAGMDMPLSAAKPPLSSRTRGRMASMVVSDSTAPAPSSPLNVQPMAIDMALEQQLPQPASTPARAPGSRGRALTPSTPDAPAAAPETGALPPVATAAHGPQADADAADTQPRSAHAITPAPAAKRSLKPGAHHHTYLRHKLAAGRHSCCRCC